MRRRAVLCTSLSHSNSLKICSFTPQTFSLSLRTKNSSCSTNNFTTEVTTPLIWHRKSFLETIQCNAHECFHVLCTYEYFPCNHRIFAVVQYQERKRNEPPTNPPNNFFSPLKIGLLILLMRTSLVHKSTITLS